MRYVILGTAGHIDHGKSALVKALTGTDPDRLKEEKERGITIDIGFAELEYPEDGLSLGIVDVPGHERLIRNMLAGAGGIDLVLMVIAADEGIMPQSREHLHICDMLKIKTGLIVITKTDLVEPEWVDMVREEVAEFVRGTFLEGARVVPVSARTGHNLDALKSAIREVALGVEPKPSSGLLRIPIDRVFTLKGFGTVVTGTAVSGTLKVGDAVEILPRGINSKVRGLHSHGRAVETAFAGQRVAVNLQGIEKEQLQRGDTIVPAGRFLPALALDARVELLDDSPPVKNRGEVHFHMGTSETLARVILYGAEQIAPGGESYCQLRLKDPVVAQAGDRFIIRRLSPLQTLGGGQVLDPSPYRRKKKDGISDLEVFYSGELTEKIGAKVLKAALNGMQKAAVQGWIRAEVPDIAAAIESLKKKGIIAEFDGVLLHEEAISAFRAALIVTLKEFHRKNPLKRGLPKEEVRGRLRVPHKAFGSLLNTVKDVVAEKDLLMLKGFVVTVSAEDKAKITSLLEDRRFHPPSVAELAVELSMDQKRAGDVLRLMHREGSIVRINDSLYMGAGAHREMIGLLKGHFSRQPEMTVAEFRDLLGTTRKYALPLLEYLDASNITLRVGDTRKLLIK